MTETYFLKGAKNMNTEKDNKNFLLDEEDSDIEDELVLLKIIKEFEEDNEEDDKKS